MLYEFHTAQNEKHPGTVHATYMVYGTKKVSHTNGHSSNDGDVEMTSSPPVPQLLAEDIPLTTLSLVAEENLSGMLCLSFRIRCSHGRTDVLLQMCFPSMRALHPSMFSAWVRTR